MLYRSPLAGLVGILGLLGIGMAMNGLAHSEVIPSSFNYGPNPHHLIDVCRPPGSSPGPMPAALLIHGGGWSGGHKEDLGWVCRYFADRGVVAATMEYRLLDGSERWPSPLIDAQLAVRWLRERASDLGIDPRRICAYGHSAGGHIAALLASQAGTFPGDYADQLSGFSSSIACAIDNWGPSDFTIPSPLQNALSRFFPTMDEPSRLKLAPEVSPIVAITASTAPIFIAHGFADIVVPVAQSTALMEALGKAKVKRFFSALTAAMNLAGFPPKPLTRYWIWRSTSFSASRRVRSITGLRKNP